jgi:hypothetical protein
MNDTVKTLCAQARKLSPSDRATLIDELLASLDECDPTLAALWAWEAEKRLANACLKGQAKGAWPESMTSTV